MKRLCAWILALVLLLSATALASVMPEADKTVLSAGETVNVAVKLDAPIEGVYGLSYDLYFNDELFDYVPASSTKGDAISGEATTLQVSAKAKTDAEGRKYALISYYDPTGEGQTVAAGTLYTIAFTAKTDIAADSEASFERKKEKVRDVSRNEIAGDAVDVPADKATLSVTVQTGSPTIALGDRRAVSARVGQEIEVPVYFNDTPTVGMAAFIVEFDSEKLSYASASSEGGIAENNVNVAVVEGGENRLMVATLGGFVTKTGRLCTLKFTVKDTASAGDTAAIALPNVTTDDGDYPMVLDENMIPVGGMKYAALTVNILAAPQVTGIALDKTALRLEAGEEAVLNATVTAEDGANTEVIWNSENEEIATVADGRITAVAEGETTITAQAGDQTATCTVTVTPAVDYGYTVELLEDQTIDIQGEATVSIVVGVGKKEERATYNAVDMELKYDSSKLKYAGEKTIGDVRISDDENGTLKLVRYGASLDVNTVLAALKFQPVAAGKAKVEFVSAKVDESDNASIQDAPDASWDKKFGFVTITIGGYTVTLPDEFEGDRATVPGQNYTFSAKETEHYDYSDVKATIDGNEVKVIDNGDGTYTIEADDITGDIIITGNRTGKIFAVTITGPDTTGAETAQYGVDYTFTIDKKSGYTYELKVNAPYTSNGDGTYTIVGTDITKNIAIEVTRTEEVKPPGWNDGHHPRRRIGCRGRGRPEPDGGQRQGLHAEAHQGCGLRLRGQGGRYGARAQRGRQLYHPWQHD